MTLYPEIMLFFHKSCPILGFFDSSWVRLIRSNTHHTQTPNNNLLITQRVAPCRNHSRLLSQFCKCLTI